MGLLTILGSISPALSATLLPDEISVYSPDGSNNTSGPYRDDVYLDNIIFGDTTYSFTDQIVAVSELKVLSGHSNINAEWGDLDDESDGDGNPFSSLGYDPSLQESTDPILQNSTLREVFNSTSLTEMTDGEGGSAFSFRTLFSKSLFDNQVGLDDIPELVIFERGMNDTFDIRLITGGTFQAPEFSDWLQIDSRDFSETGIWVDTVEIGGAQHVGAGGFDLDAFNITPYARVYGLEVRSTNNTGPDLNGFFLTAADSSSFGEPLATVPVQGSTLAFLAIACLSLSRFRNFSKDNV